MPVRRIKGGAFRGHRPAPSSAAHATVLEDLADQMTGPAGLTAAPSSGRRGYRGGLLAPQDFVRPPAHPNATENLEVARVQVNARRALNRGRGRPEAL